MLGAVPGSVDKDYGWFRHGYGMRVGCDGVDLELVTIES
jgi:hypothetical protein